jgi:hypothetical protein
VAFCLLSLFVIPLLFLVVNMNRSRYTDESLLGQDPTLLASARPHTDGMSFTVGEKAFSLNPKYKDGTRLRALAAADSAFNGVWCPNDIQLQIVEVEGEFLRVQKPDGQSGWIRNRNLTRSQRVAGVTKGWKILFFFAPFLILFPSGIITTEIVTPGMLLRSVCCCFC